jgi:hypothetical protein
MPSPYTDSERAQIFEIMGIPLNGSGVIGVELSHMPGTIMEVYQPTWITADMSGFVTAMDAQLATNTADQAVRARIQLSRWASIGKTNPLVVKSGATGTGTLVDFPTERQSVRDALSDAIGISIPWGSWVEQVKQYFGTSRPQPMGDR